MAERETSRSIDDAAAAWVAREDRASLSPGDAQALQTWLESDPRCAGALLRARAVAMRGESAVALGRGYDPALFRASSERTPLSRRRLLGWGSGLAASLAVATVAGIGLRAPDAHATERGEIRLVPLADGSTVMLNTQTRVRVNYDDAIRRVRLIGGEADFTVLADPKRPFVVEAGSRRLHVSGIGAFRVRMLKEAPVDILVHRGRVDLVSKDDRAGGVSLGPNTRLVLQGGAVMTTLKPESVAPDLVTRELAWREGKIAFQGESLSEAAAAFTRYSGTRIVIDDLALSREPITGLFAASDPAGFGHAVAGLFDASVVERNGVVILSRRKTGQ